MFDRRGVAETEQLQGGAVIPLPISDNALAEDVEVEVFERKMSRLWMRSGVVSRLGCDEACIAPGIPGLKLKQIWFEQILAW